MTDSKKATAQTQIAASVQNCFDVASNLSDYPSWADGIELVEIKETDSEGHASIVEFKAESFGRKMRYTLKYDFSDAPNAISWSLVEGDLVTQLDGKYSFASNDTNETEVSYSLEIDLSVALPGFIKRRAEEKVLESALEAFKNQVEALN